MIQILEIENELDMNAYIQMVKYILEHKEESYLFLNRHAFLFDAFRDFLLEKIDLEVFMQTGDF
ncbi:MAG: hypothetical protein GXP45_08450 [bacterium]|nr:hypothetical protein [bacterium]